jgi:hypothetical protein
MTAEQFVEFVAALPPEKQVGAGRKLARIVETALRVREKHGLNLDPVARVCAAGSA